MRLRFYLQRPRFPRCLSTNRISAGINNLLFMSVSPTLVTVRLEEMDNKALLLDWIGPRSYEGYPFNFHNELERQQQLQILYKQRVDYISWELRSVKEAVFVMTHLLPNSK